MPAPQPNVTTLAVPGADAEVISWFYPVPALGFVPINAFLLRAEQPVLIDTGPIALREQYLAAIEQLIDLDELSWIYLTHADPDHVGCLRDVLAAAPKARLVTTFIGLGRLGLYESIPPDRVYLLNPGQQLAVGDRVLNVIAPATFDAPETTAISDSKTGTLFSSDSFGGVLAGPVDTAAALTASALRDAVVTWVTIDTPWIHDTTEAALDARLRRIRDLAAPIVLGSHLPPAFGMLDTLIDHVASARTAPRFVGLDQAALSALLAAAGPRPVDAATENVR